MEVTKYVNGVPFQRYITFGEFDSRKIFARSIERVAHSPKEKEIVESLDYMQGEIDFSALYGQKYFENRIISYEFMIFHLPMGDREWLQQEVKRMLVMQSNQKLYDSHDRGFFWLGKAIDVKVFEEPKIDGLRLEIDFSLYPFMKRDKDFFDDNWNTFDFDNDIANYTAYEVDGELVIEIYNNGDNVIEPIIFVEVVE